MADSKPRRWLKHLGLLAIACVIFTAGRIAAEHIWGVTYDTRSLEILVAAFIFLHLGIPRLARHFSRSKPPALRNDKPSAATGTEADATADARAP